MDRMSSALNMEMREDEKALLAQADACRKCGPRVSSGGGQQKARRAEIVPRLQREAAQEPKLLPKIRPQPTPRSGHGQY
jgi:hypothetical protein